MPAEAGAQVAFTSTDLALRELVRANVELARQNTELAKTVATQQPDLVKAAADILRAADGAGLPRREPMADWYDDEEDHEAEAARRPTFDIGAIVRLTGMDPGKVGVLMGSGDGVARTAAINTTTPKQLPTKSHARTSHAPSEPRRTTEPAKDEQTVAPDPIAHFIAIQAQLTADERAYVQNVINKPDVADRKQSRAQLARTPVEEAVSMIRTEIEKPKEKVL